jgi:hypothetical protein
VEIEMTSNTPDRATRLRRLFRANMLLGALVVTVSGYFMISGSYPDLATRHATESVLNIAMIGGMLYGVAFWYACWFSRPYLEKRYRDRR